MEASPPLHRRISLWRLVLPVSFLTGSVLLALVFLLGPLPPAEAPADHFPPVHLYPQFQPDSQSPGQPRAQGLPRRALIAIGSGQLYHPGATQLTFSTDGQYLASATPTGSVHIWETKSGGLRQTLAIEPARAMAFTTDSLKLWSIAESGLHIRDLSNDNDMGVGIADPARASGLPSANFKDLVAKTTEGEIQVWNLERAREDNRVPLTTPASQLLAIASDAGAFLETDSGGAALCEGKTGLRRVHLEVEQHPLTAAAFAAVTGLLATVCEGGEISLWEGATGNWIGRCPLPCPRADRLVISANARTVAVAGNGALQVWNTQGPILKPRTSGPLSAPALSADGSQCAALTADGQILLWDTTTGQEPFAGPPRRWPVGLAHLAPTGKTLITCSGIGGLRLWNVASGSEEPGKDSAAPIADISLECLDVFARQASDTVTAPAPVQAIAYSPDGQLLSIAQSGILQLRDLYSNTTSHLKCGSNGTLALAFSADGHELARVSTSGLELFHLGSNSSEPRRLDQIPDTLTSGELGFTDKGDQLVYIPRGSDHAFSWDTTTGELKATIPLPPGLHFTSGAGLSDALQTLAVGSEPDTVWRVDLTGKNRSVRLSHRGAAVTAVALSHNGTTAAVAGATGAIYVSNLVNGQSLGLEGHGAPVVHMEFSRNGTRLLSTCADGVALVWDLSSPAAPTVTFR